jgi:hypothetical protein
MFDVERSMLDVPSSSPSPPSSFNLHPFCLADRLARSGPDSEALSQSLLTRLVALNHERAAEEKRGHIRWLRPDYQAPQAGSGPSKIQNHQSSIINPPASQPTLDLPPDAPPPSSFTPQPSSLSPAWPSALPEQVLAIRNLLPAHGPDPAALSAVFGRKSQKREEQIRSILATLEALGRV